MGCPIIRVLECLLAKLIDTTLAMRRFYHESQLGYCRGIGCTESLIGTLWWILKKLNNKNTEEVRMYLFDQTSAFDRIDFALLIRKLKHEARISGDYLAWIVKWLSNRTTCTKWSGTFTNKRKMTSGTPQGSGLSAVFFKIYLNESLKKFETWISELEIDATFFAFADDVKYLVSFPKSRPDDYDNRVKEFFRRVEAEYKRIGMLTNAAKCKYMRFADKNASPIEIEIAIKDAKGIAIPIEYSEIERDLGLITDNKLTYENHRRKIISKAWTSLNFTTLALKKMTFQTAVVSWNNVFGQISYLSELWWNGDEKTFDRPYKAFFKWQSAPIDTKMTKKMGTITRSKVPWAPSQSYLLKDLKLIHRILHQNRIPERCINSRDIFPNFHKDQEPRSLHEKTRMSLLRSKLSKFFITDRNEKYWNEIPPHIRNDANTEQFQTYVETKILTKLPIEEFRSGISNGEQLMKAKIHQNHKRKTKPMNKDYDNRPYRKRKAARRKERKSLTNDEKRILDGKFNWDDQEREFEKYYELTEKMKIKINESKHQAKHLKDCNCLMVHCKLIRRTLSRLRKRGVAEMDLNQANHDTLCNCGQYKNHERSKLKLNHSLLRDKIYGTRCPESVFSRQKMTNRSSNCNCFGRVDRCIYLFHE